MSLTKVSYSMINQAPINVADYGFSPSETAANNVAAIASAVAQINSLGSGTLIFPQGTYNIWSALPSVTLAAFSSCTNVSIINQGCILNVTYGWTGAEFKTLFQFTNCKNLYLDLPELISPVQPVNERGDRGPVLLEFLGNCSNIQIPRIKATGALTVITAIAASTATDAQRTSNINVGVGYAYNCGYGLSFQFSGDDVFVGMWNSYAPHRSYFPYGVRNHVVNIESRDQDADDVNLSSYSGKGLLNISVNYTNVSSTTAQSAAPAVAITYGDQTPAIHRNIRINVMLNWPATGQFGAGFVIQKFNNSGTYDTVDRGHSLTGLTFSGVMKSDSAGANVPITMFGTWGPGEFWQNIVFKDLYFASTASATVDLGSSQDPAVFDNIDTSSAFYISNAPSTAITIARACKASRFTPDATDTGYVVYYDCEIADNTDQSIINKTFINFKNGILLANDFAKTGRGSCYTSNILDGNLTTQRNVFFVKLVSSGGGLFRLSYALQDGGNQTIGIKTFSATLNSAGTWTAVLAVADEVTQRNSGTASAVTVTLVNGTTAGAYIAVTCTNYSGASATGAFQLEFMPLMSDFVLYNTFLPA